MTMHAKLVSKISIRAIDVLDFMNKKKQPTPCAIRYIDLCQMPSSRINFNLPLRERSRGDVWMNFEFSVQIFFDFFCN